MSRRLGAMLLGLVALVSPAHGLDVLDAELRVSYEHEGKGYVFEDHVVPLLPDNACYNWYIRSAAVGTPLTAIERMTLPEPIDWSPVTGAPGNTTEVEQLGKVAITTLSVTTDDEGWFTHGWCVAEGDPLGQHTIEVSVEGEPLAAFHFVVVPPEGYGFPLKARMPADRSADMTW